MIIGCVTEPIPDQDGHLQHYTQYLITLLPYYTGIIPMVLYQYINFINKITIIVTHTSDSQEEK